MRRKASGRNQDAFYKKAWREAAESLGGQCVLLGDRFSQITVDGVTTRVVENYSEIDDPVTLAVMHDKALTHQILNGVGLTTPKHATFSLGRIGPAIEFLESSERHCVVKPAGGTGGGRGVTTGIRTRSHLARAAAAAACYADELLIEEQLEGDNYRLLYLDGELIDAFVCRPPGVVGDGRSSVAQLVRQANDDRLRNGSDLSQVLIAVDLDMRHAGPPELHACLGSPSGKARHAENRHQRELRSRQFNRDRRLVQFDRQRRQESGEGAARSFAGIDLITTDPTVPLAESGGAIIEVNGTPNLYYHYHKKDSVFPVAIPLLRRILIERQLAERE